MNDIETARLLLNAFRGREDHVAVANEKGFAPQKLPSPMKPEWLQTRHLGKEKCLGFYLMTPESKVWCSCVDFDNKPTSPDPDWQGKVSTVALWLIKAGLCPLAEISASGNGAHVWLFFEEPTPAWMVRGFWRVVEKQTGVPFREIYPRQDQLDGKGLGNLVRYPLWNQSRFVDIEGDWETVPPIEALATIRRTTGSELKELAFSLGQTIHQEPPRPRGPATTSTVADAELPPRVKDRLDRKPHSFLARRWRGDRQGMKDNSTSALVLSIACELVRQYVPTAEIEAALRYWCSENDYPKGSEDRALSRCLGQAYEFVLSRIEEASATSALMRDCCHAYIDRIDRGEVIHVGSGIADLDSSIQGAAPGEMVVIGARPSHGKSAFALQWLDHAASQGLPGLMVSEEMSNTELGKRALLSITDLEEMAWDRNTVDFLRRDVDDHYQPRAPIHVVENCNSIDRVEDVIDQFCGVHGVKLVAVDYLQLLGSRKNSRYEEVTDISKRLKQAAKRNGISLLVLCQLNRDIENRSSFEPKLRDLRDSGQIEQDADLILFLQYPFMYDPTADPRLFFVHAAKRRNGEIKQRQVKLSFQRERQSFGIYVDPQTMRAMDELPD